MNLTLDNNRNNLGSESNEKVAICISASSDLAFAAAVTFLNFIDIHGAEGFHFRLFSDAKIPGMVKIFKDLGADLEVEVFRPPVSWRKMWASKAIAYFTPLVLAKFEGFRLLSSFPTVVWLDYDIVITRSLSELWTRRDFDLAYSGSGQPMAKGFTVPPKSVDHHKEGMFAGVLVFRQTFESHKEANRDLYSIFSQYFSDLYYPEQAVFDLYLDAHNSFKRWKLDERFCAYPGKESNSSLILHSFGSKKFWNGIHNEAWNNYYSQWLSIGGWGWHPMRSKIRKFWRGLRHLYALFLISFR